MMTHRLLRFIMALVTFFLILELCARLDDAALYSAPIWGKYSNESLSSKDSDGIPYNVPNAHFEKWRHNSKGFRGPELVTTKPKETLRIVIMGSSESYGLYESPGMEWPSQLQTLMPKPEYEVINASVVGLDLRNTAAYLSKYVYPINPDVIVLVVSPLLYVTTLEKEISEKGSKLRIGVGQEQKKIMLTKKVLQQSRILPKAKQAIKSMLMSNFPRILQRYQIWKLQKQIIQIEAARLKGKKTLDRIPDVYLETFRSDLNILIESIRSHGCQVMLATSPTLMDQDNLNKHLEIFLDSRRFFIGLSFAGMIDAVKNVNKEIVDIAADQGTLFVDIAALLPKSTEYFSDNNHFTDKGSRVIAEAVAAQFQ